MRASSRSPHSLPSLKRTLSGELTRTCGRVVPPAGVRIAQSWPAELDALVPLTLSPATADASLAHFTLGLEMVDGAPYVAALVEYAAPAAAPAPSPASASPSAAPAPTPSSPAGGEKPSAKKEEAPAPKDEAAKPEKKVTDSNADARREERSGKKKSQKKK